MSNFFNMDNKFFSAMSRVADLMILNLLVLLCSLPIVTIGPALTALYYMTLKMVRNEESYIVRGFFHSFRQNLKQGIVINVIMLIAGGILAFDIYYANALGQTQTAGRILLFLFLILLVFYLMMYTFVYPVLAKFDNTTRNTFRNAILMAIRHLPFTLLMILIMLVPFALFFFAPIGQLQSVVLMLYILMGLSLSAFCKSFLLVRVFDKYIPAEEDTETDLSEGSEQ